MSEDLKVTAIATAGRELPSTVAIDAVYTGDDADFDGAPGVGGQDQWKQPVRCATTASITIATALNAGDTIDGVTLVAGDRVLVKDQGAPEGNGIYVAGTTPVRAADMDDDLEVLGAVVYVIDGTANAATVWTCTNTAATVVDTDAIDWAQLTGGGGGTPATTVTDETTWGISPAVGTDTEYARQDHTHGTPADPGSGGGGGSSVPPVIQSVSQYAASGTPNTLTVTAPTHTGLIALVQSQDRGATSITQTNVTWTQRYTANAGGMYVEVWTGALTGSAGTTVTFNFSTSTQSYVTFTEIDCAALTSVGTATTSTASGTTALISFTGASDGDLCIALETSYNSNSGYIVSSLPLAVLSWSGCLNSGLFYYRRPRAGFAFVQSSGATRLSVVIRVS